MRPDVYHRYLTSHIDAALRGAVIACLLLALAFTAQAELSLSGTPDLEVVSLMAEGDGALKSGAFDQALIHYQAVLMISPEHAVAHYQMGVTLIQLGKMAEGIAAIEHALKISPDNITIRLALANMYEFLNQMNQALLEYERVIASLPADDERALQVIKKRDFIKANQKASQGDIQAAMIAFTRLNESYPDDVSIIYGLGLTKMLLQDVVNAEQLFQRVLVLDSTYLNAYWGLTNLYEANNDLTSAVLILQRLIASAKTPAIIDQAQMRLNLLEGKILMQQGNLQDALQVFQALEARSSSDLAVLLSLAKVFRLMEKAPEEEKYYRQVLQVKPTQLDARVRLAEIMLVSNRIDEAIKQLGQVVTLGRGSAYADQATMMLAQIRKAQNQQAPAALSLQMQIQRLLDGIADDPSNVALRLALATRYLQGRMLEQARASFNEVLVLDSTNQKAYLGLGTAYDQMGMNDEAVSAYAHAIALDVEGEMAVQWVILLRMAVAKSSYLRGQIAMTKTEVAAVLKAAPRFALAYFYQALVQTAENSFVAAVKSYQLVLQLMPGHMGAQLNMATLYERLNREEDAMAIYRKILQSNTAGALVTEVELKLKMVESRLRGMSASLGYSVSIDDNSNLSEAGGATEYRSDLAISLAYQMKMSNGIRLRASASPVYSVHHKGQYDFLNNNVALTASIYPSQYTLTAGFSRRTSNALINIARFSDSTTLFGEAERQYFLPYMTRPLSGERALTGVTLNGSFTDLNSVSSPFFSAFNYSARGTVSQPLGYFRASVDVGLSLALNKNKEAVGSDYAYFSKALDINLKRDGWRGGIYNLGININRFDYSNPDSLSNFTVFRRNTLFSYRAGVTFRLRRDMQWYARYSWVDNHSNQPTIVLNALDIIEGQLSSSLGDYQRGQLTVGLQVFF